MTKVWDKKACKTSIEILRRNSSYQRALEDISSSLGRSVTKDALVNALKSNGFAPPSSYLGQGESASQDKPLRKEPIKIVGKNISTPELDKLLKLLKKEEFLSLENLCNSLDCSPKKAKELIETAQANGLDIQISAGSIGLSPELESPHPEVNTTGISPVVGERQKVAVISDTHFGSKYCMREQIKDFVNYAYSEGIREILHCGDFCDGSYSHGWLELTHVGLEDQIRDAFEVLPQLPGLSYHAITGNHDETFWKTSGVNVGTSIKGYFQENGRFDFNFYGDRSAFLSVRGAVIELWHPMGSGSYAKSYKLQKHIEGYLSIKPQICLAGHFHQFCHVFERGVHGILCPTFQGSGSRFSKALGGAQAQGGLILSWTVTELGAIRNFSVEKRSYYEIERPVDIFDRIEATGVDKSLYRSHAIRG